jgi:hypothetical protein
LDQRRLVAEFPFQRRQVVDIAWQASRLQEDKSKQGRFAVGLD